MTAITVRPPRFDRRESGTLAHADQTDHRAAASIVDRLIDHLIGAGVIPPA
ncbi:MAG: hypothetical protein ACRENQ_06070 [Gemmatimonadaceae bacterium]